MTSYLSVTSRTRTELIDITADVQDLVSMVPARGRSRSGLPQVSPSPFPINFMSFVSNSSASSGR